MENAGWRLTADERTVLAAALDALLPPAGSFPLPSSTDLIDAFILARVPAEAGPVVPYPGQAHPLRRDFHVRKRYFWEDDRAQGGPKSRTSDESSTKS